MGTGDIHTLSSWMQSWRLVTTIAAATAFLIAAGCSKSDNTPAASKAQEVKIIRVSDYGLMFDSTGATKEGLIVTYRIGNKSMQIITVPKATANDTTILAAIRAKQASLPDLEGKTYKLK